MTHEQLFATAFLSVISLFVILFACNPLKKGAAYTRKDYIND